MLALPIAVYFFPLLTIFNNHSKNKFEKLKQERIQRYQGVNLYVKNLDDSITDDILREHFSQFGTITSAKVQMMTDRNVSMNFKFEAQAVVLTQMQESLVFVRLKAFMVRLIIEPPVVTMTRF